MFRFTESGLGIGPVQGLPLNVPCVASGDLLLSVPGSVLLLVFGITPRSPPGVDLFLTNFDNSGMDNVVGAAVAGDVVLATSRCAVSCVGAAGAAVSCICGPAPFIVA